MASPPDDEGRTPISEAEIASSDVELHVRGVKRGAAGIFAGMVGQQAIRFGTALVVSHTLGAEILGAYGLLLGMQRFTDVFGHRGLVEANLKYVARCLSLRRPNGVRATAAITIGMSAVMGLLLLGLLWALAPALMGPAVYHRPELVEPLRISVWAVPLTGVMLAMLTVLQGARIVGPIVWISRIAAPLLFLLGVAVVAWRRAGLEEVLYAHVGSAAVGLAAAGIVLIRWLPPKQPGGPVGVSLREVTAFAAVMCLLSGSHLIIGQADMLVLGKYVTDEELGWYFACVRVAALIGYPMSAISGAFTPTVSALVARDDREGLRSLFIQTTSWSTGAAFAVFGVAAVAPELVMSAFGEGFAGGAAPLVVLSIGQLLNGATGCNASMLTMTGKQRIATWTSWGAAIALLAALPWCVAEWGLVGAAAAVGAVVGATNVVRMLWIWRHLHMQPYTRDYWIAFAATSGIIAGCALLSRSDSTHAGLLTYAALALFFALYAVTAGAYWFRGLLRRIRERSS